MKQCGFCGIYNEDSVVECTKCGAQLAVVPARLQRTCRFGPTKAHEIRGKFLTAIVLGLMMKVYWGGYGPWPVIDVPVLTDVRPWLEPLLLYGGGVGYLAGWVLNWV